MAYGHTTYAAIQNDNRQFPGQVLILIFIPGVSFRSKEFPSINAMNGHYSISLLPGPGFSGY